MNRSIIELNLIVKRVSVKNSEIYNGLVSILCLFIRVFFIAFKSSLKYQEMIINFIGKLSLHVKLSTTYLESR